jgi:hypothetical protein
MRLNHLMTTTRGNGLPLSPKPARGGVDRAGTPS